jgi:hypothetical protein
MSGMRVRWATLAVVLASATLVSAIHAVVKLRRRRESRPEGIVYISTPANPKFESEPILCRSKPMTY